jgi:glutamate-5-semialdehyde dehydrogenase
MTLSEQMAELGRQAKEASRALALLSPAQKNDCLEAMAGALEAGLSAISAANQLDMAAGARSGLSPAMLDRLKLDEKRVLAMAKGIRELAKLPDPVGRVLDERVRPNGLRLVKKSVPIGVVVVIYESRPNVTADAAGICFKSGNAVILRGGKEALRSNTAIAEAMVTAAAKAVPAFPGGAIQVVPTPDREAIRELLSLSQYIDLCMPRGGEGLIRAVAEVSRVPVIKHYKGVCHVYVDAAADFGMAENIVVNAKVQRPGVCNAMETLLVDRAVATEFLPRIAKTLRDKKVELRVDAASQDILRPSFGQLPAATEEDWSAEYLDLILAVKVVDGVDAAIGHVNRYGSAHSDTIVTGNERAAARFLDAVDSAAVYWNASTRFTDGGEFGMGAEIGISTDKVGGRGPLGLDELTTYKWIGYGQGQVRV